MALFTAVMLPMFLGAVDQTLLATATPRIAAELGALSDTSWIAVGYLLAATVTAPLYGRLGDRLGRKQAMLAAIAVFSVGSIACAVAPTMTGPAAGSVTRPDGKCAHDAGSLWIAYRSAASASTGSSSHSRAACSP